MCKQASIGATGVSVRPGQAQNIDYYTKYDMRPTPEAGTQCQQLLMREFKKVCGKQTSHLLVLPINHRMVQRK